MYQVIYQNALIWDGLNTITRMHEIRAGLWVRNGQTIRHLVNFYRSPRFAGQTFDLDLHGLQVAFARRCTSLGGCGEVLEALCGASRTTRLDGAWLSREDLNDDDDDVV